MSSEAPCHKIDHFFLLCITDKRDQLVCEDLVYWTATNWKRNDKENIWTDSELTWLRAAELQH